MLHNALDERYFMTVLTHLRLYRRYILMLFTEAEFPHIHLCLVLSVSVSLGAI